MQGFQKLRENSKLQSSAVNKKQTCKPSKPKVMGKLEHRPFQTVTSRKRRASIFTDPFVRVRRTGHKLQHLCPLLSQTPAVEDLSVALLKVIKLLRIGRVQKPG